MEWSEWLAMRHIAVGTSVEKGSQFQSLSPELPTEPTFCPCPGLSGSFPWQVETSTILTCFKPGTHLSYPISIGDSLLECDCGWFSSVCLGMQTCIRGLVLCSCLLFCWGWGDRLLCDLTCWKMALDLRKSSLGVEVMRFKKKTPLWYLDCGC